MSMARIIAEDQRLHVLRALDEANGDSINENLLKRALHHVGHKNLSLDTVRQLLAWLADSGLVRIEKLEDDASATGLWIAYLRDDGRDVARGRPFVGVAEPTQR